jgi:uridine kinase
MSKIQYVIKQSGDKVPFNRNRIVNALYRAAIAVGERNRKQIEQLTDQIIEKLELEFSEKKIPHIEEIQDIAEYILIKNGQTKTAKAYILYRAENIRNREKNSKQDNRLSENIPWAKCWQILDWAVTHSLNTIELLNQKIKAGKIKEIIQESEHAYQRDIAHAAELIIDRAKETKLVIVTGPSSSGKTTTTHKLENYLNREGLKFAALNVDHYFFDLAMHPKDEFGDYDFETPQALDLDLINEHLNRLVKGEKVLIPTYDFKTGTRKLDQIPMQIHEDEIILLDSLHGLYPDMTASIASENKFKLYLEPLMQLKAADGRYVRWTDIRLIRRMLRDSAFRAYNPTQTLEHWHYVRTSELRNIIPYINTTDYVINSAMPYEIALYAHKLGKEFAKWVEKYREDPLKLDAYTRALRINEVLKQTEPWNDDSIVPEDSVLREFIGGSSIKYH